MKIKNVSGKIKNFKVKNEWLTIEPDGTVELADNVIEAEQGLEELIIEEVMVEESVDGLWTKTDLIDMMKKDQVEILKAMGCKDIKKLKNEKQRVEKILELQ